MVCKYVQKKNILTSKKSSDFGAFLSLEVLYARSECMLFRHILSHRPITFKLKFQLHTTEESERKLGFQIREVQDQNEDLEFRTLELEEQVEKV